jgi:hypothetical protein
MSAALGNSSAVEGDAVIAKVDLDGWVDRDVQLAGLATRHGRRAYTRGEEHGTRARIRGIRPEPFDGRSTS